MGSMDMCICSQKTHQISQIKPSHLRLQLEQIKGKKKNEKETKNFRDIKEVSRENSTSAAVFCLDQ